jgi:phage terminase large subunit-like protein
MENVGDCLQIDAVTKHWDTKFEEPPRIWIVSDTEETAINVIERTIVDQVLGKDETGFLWNFIDDSCQYTDKNGWSDHQIRFTNGAWIQVKFSTQKRNTFQGVRLDKVHHDEVQPKDVYGECVARLADTNGYFIGTMTPIYDEKAGKGIPWIYQDLYMVRDSKNISFHQWSMLDNPYIPQEAKDRLMGQWDEDEVDARVYGMFVPIGVKLAFPTKLIRSFKPDIVEPDYKSQLMYDEEGNIILEAA